MSPQRRADLDRLHHSRQQQQAAGITHLQSYEESYSGPLPHPADIERFDQLYPGAAEIIFRSFDEQGSHRRALEKRVVEGTEARQSRGQWMALAVLLSGITSGTVIAITTSAVAGASVATATVGSGALMWILGGRPPKD